jgi:hypothetical protein
MARTATNRLEAAQAAIEETNRKLAELTERRNAALLRDADAEAIRLGTEIDTLHQAAKTHEDKIRLLRAAAAEEERERKVKEREGLIKRIEAKFAERDVHSQRLADAVAVADRDYR